MKICSSLAGIQAGRVGGFFAARLAGPLAALCIGLLPSLAARAQELMPQITTATQTTNALRSNSAKAVANCPDRGGLLDSISVPVGQPLNLRVQIGQPAPRGGATFQLNSDDPSIVAAGDRRQGFLPRVFIPEGQTVSNQFTGFGIKVGATRLRLVALTAGFGSGSFPLGAWNLNKGGDERFVDANAATKTCRASDGSNDLSADPARLAQCGTPAKGVAADALSRLLLRGVSGLPGTMCYEITSTSAFGQGQLSASLLTTQSVGGLEYGFSFYKAPQAYEDSADFRKLEFEVTFTPSIGNGNTTRFRAETKIVRPPVVLVHGVWSKAGAWGSDYTKDDPYHSTVAGDYSGSNGARYTTNAPLIQEFVNRGLKAARDKGYAATQADVLGHSMGGILTRLYIGSSTFKRPDNFGQGDVRRLISLDTPHSGSTFPNMVTSLHRLRRLLPQRHACDPGITRRHRSKRRGVLAVQIGCLAGQRRLQHVVHGGGHGRTVVGCGCAGVGEIGLVAPVDGVERDVSGAEGHREDAGLHHRRQARWCKGSVIGHGLRGNGAPLRRGRSVEWGWFGVDAAAAAGSKQQGRGDGNQFADHGVSLGQVDVGAGSAQNGAPATRR